MLRITVTDDERGQRIDKLVANKLAKYPRTVIQKLFEDNSITLNNKETKPGFKLRPGDTISVDTSKLTVNIPDIDLPVLYEDDDVLVVNKPSGVISHARGKYFDEPSVASFVRQKTNQEGDRAGIVHRLDRATSGVMVCAKNFDTLSYLQKQFSARKVKKSYQAIIEGKMPTPEGVIDMPIARNPKKPKMFHVSETGKDALTRYKTIESSDKYSQIELTPETGRTHQLRVHLNQLHRPIVGDELYQGAEANRLMLHAIKLEISIPGGIRKVFEAPLPPEFKEYI